VLAAAQQRSTRRSDQKPPVYFYIDECQTVIARDEKIPTILDECRSQNIALIMAHQRTKQIGLLDALSNCAIRFANSDEEARFLAPRLRALPDFLQSLKRGQFAAFVRDMTKEAVAISVNRVDFREHAVLSHSERTELAQRVRAQYGPPPQDTSPISPSYELDQSDVPNNRSTTSPPVIKPVATHPTRTEDSPKPRSERGSVAVHAPNPKATNDISTQGGTDWR
jgi:hypothetical protein